MKITAKYLQFYVAYSARNSAARQWCYRLDTGNGSTGKYFKTKGAEKVADLGEP